MQSGIRLWNLSLSMYVFLFLMGCDGKQKELETFDSMNDAALVEAQLKQLYQTRANEAYSTVLITKGTHVNFQVEGTGRVLVDWGDGNREYNVFTHVYTDQFPAHTICFYDPDTTITELGCLMSQLIFLDVTKNVNLKKLMCSINWLTSLDISQNKSLQELQCSGNKLEVLDVSQNVELNALVCSHNYLHSLNIEHSTNLQELNCMDNLLSSLNLANCNMLKILNCSGNKLDKLNIVYNKDLKEINCSNNPFERVDNEILSFLQGLPNRGGKEKGKLTFSSVLGESGSLDAVQTFCTVFNWELSY